MTEREMSDVRKQIRAWTQRPPQRPTAAARTRVLARIWELSRGRGGRPAPWRRFRWRLAVGTAVARRSPSGS